MNAFARRWLRRLLILLTLTVMTLLAGLGVAWYYYRELVVLHPGDHIKREQILQRIAMESPIYYSDEQHKMGVFFGAEHRQYVKYADIPKDFINAIVSSEDARFFEHPGIDVQGITRAMISNLKAGRIVAGGSTITQQTAKNLYYRNERSFQAKWDELLNALRLEAQYSKKEIFEFYANQFHVHSNGRGLGIAARYFFDKDVSQLSRLECAFLAGVVKGPFRYNPFVGTTEEARARARQRARDRTWYVLNRMAANGYLKPDEVKELRSQELVFKEGDFRYDHNVILDHVFATLGEEPFSTILEENRIDNPATAGIKVITTIDREWQQAAQYGLRHNLSDVGALLEGLTIEAFMGPAEPLMPIQREDILPYGFLEGVVRGPVLEGKDAPYLEVDLGGVTGRVEKAGLKRVANLLKQAKGQNRWTEASKEDITTLANALTPGRRVYLSVKDILADGTPVLDLEANTALQGAVVVLDQGKIRAMVGGQDNRNFNRATSARRQLGSTWKPLTFAAALSLGWTPTAALDNRRQGFMYQGQWYWPRPDHDGIKPFVSMAYGGSTSENLTAVSLLYHLTDHLTEDQLTDLADKVGLAPQPNEPPDAFVARIRDKQGIIPTETGLEEGLYQNLRPVVAADLRFAGKAGEADALQWLPFGNGFEAELARTQKENKLSAEEKAERRRFLSRGFMQLESLVPQAQADVERVTRVGGPLQEAVQAVAGAAGSLFGRQPTPPQDDALESALKRFYIWQDGDLQRLVYSANGDSRWRKASYEEVRSLLKNGSGMRLEARPEPARTEPARRPGLLSSIFSVGPNGPVDGERPNPPQAGAENPPQPTDGQPPISGSRLPEDNVLLEGTLSLSTVTKIRTDLNERIQIGATWDKFSLQRLVNQPDFRVLVGLQYVIQLARSVGVISPMKPVLSLTLGANEISLLESASLYQTFLEGKAYGITPEKPSAAIISKIISPSGDVLYELKQETRTVLDPTVGPSVGRILRAVVERGTAAKARQALHLASADADRNKKFQRLKYVVPFMGKTGTTNDYLNVAFLGFLPAADGSLAALPYAQSLTIATYVGYDDNRPMKRGSIRIQGSSGALPAWLDTAQGILRDLDAGGPVKLEGLKASEELRIQWPEGMQPVPVHRETGLRTSPGLLPPDAPVPQGQALYEVFGQPEGDTFREQEAYLPFKRWSAVEAEAQPGKLEAPANGVPANEVGAQEVDMGAAGAASGTGSGAEVPATDGNAPGNGTGVDGNGAAGGAAGGLGSDGGSRPTTEGNGRPDSPRTDANGAEAPRGESSRPETGSNPNPDAPR